MNGIAQSIWMTVTYNIGVKVVLPHASSDSTLTPIFGTFVMPYCSLHAIHKKGFSTPLRSQALYGGSGLVTSTHPHTYAQLACVSMVQDDVLPVCFLSALTVVPIAHLRAHLSASFVILVSAAEYNKYTQSYPDMIDLCALGSHIISMKNHPR